MGGAKEQGPDPYAGPAGGRDEVLDLVRFGCLALVVVGHTMMVSPVLHADGTVTSENTLGNQDWFEPVIWVFMVMPLSCWQPCSLDSGWPDGLGCTPRWCS